MTTVRQALHGLPPRGNVLELACGTGLWTKELAQYDVVITALDASPEVLKINEARVQSQRVRYIEANIFDWSPAERFDTIVFAFWLTHVPPHRFATFWEMLEESLAPGGRVFFVDNCWYPEYRWGRKSAPLTGESLIDRPWVVSRQLNDGQRFDIVKVFYDAPDLTKRLEAMGWTGEISETPDFFIYGDLHRLTAAT